MGLRSRARVELRYYETKTKFEYWVLKPGAISK